MSNVQQALVKEFNGLSSVFLFDYVYARFNRQLSSGAVFTGLGDLIVSEWFGERGGIERTSSALINLAVSRGDSCGYEMADSVFEAFSHRESFWAGAGRNSGLALKYAGFKQVLESELYK